MTALVVDLVLATLGLPMALVAVYLATLALLSRRTPPLYLRGAPTPQSPGPELRRPPTPGTAGASGVHFAVVIPAHDEEASVATTVASVLESDYPREMFSVLVVADNCSDRTAQVAAKAGARVMVRHDAERRGKGYALAFAFETLLEERVADAFVVIDADTLVSSNLLVALAARHATGAQALQAHYGVSNPSASWRTRLLTLAFALSHGVRSQGRERLGLSCGLRGNGMSFTAGLLRQVPYGAFSIVEDIEYGILLGLAGERVHYVPEAEVRGEMPSSEQASRSQRRRWEEGRLALRRRYAWALLSRAVAKPSAVLFDLGLDLIVPPLAALAVASGTGLTLSMAALALGLALVVAPWVFLLACTGLLGYVLRGWWLSGIRLRDLVLWAPVYVFWKLGLRLAPRATAAGEWVRTERERAL